MQAGEVCMGNAQAVVSAVLLLPLPCCCLLTQQLIDLPITSQRCSPAAAAAAAVAITSCSCTFRGSMVKVGQGRQPANVAG
jgi:hypothetical protein